MAHAANPRRSLRTASTSLLLSLCAHGLLLLLAVWFWPASSRKTAGVIESTRICLDACRIEPVSPVLLPGDDMPIDLRGSEGAIAFAPRLTEPPPSLKRPDPVPVPQPAPVSNGKTGNGNGNGIGNGNIPANDRRLFSLPETARRVVYVLDRSVSMGEGDKLDLACREVLASLRQLPATAQFQVILYNDAPSPLLIGGYLDLLPIEPAILDRVAEQLKDLPARGGTNHVNALLCGLRLRPDVLFFVTDADELPYEQIDSITRGNSAGAAIHILELTRRRGGSSDGPLARLAHANGGTYRRVSLGN